jgi:glycosyltransferase involved in cell wall biosynthesis
MGLKLPLLAQSHDSQRNGQRAPARYQAGGLRVEPIRVLFLNTRDTLGADVAVHITVARAIDKTQAQVWAATGLHETGPDSARAEFAAIQELTVLPLELGRPIWGERGTGRLVAMLANLQGVANLVSLAIRCRREDIDIIHVTDRPRDALFGLILARLAGCACLIHAHINYTAHDFTNLSKWALRNSDAIVAVSNFTAATYRNATALKIRRVYALPNAVDTTLFGKCVTHEQRLAMRERLDVPAGVPLIACVARLMQWKDQATLLQAVAQLTDDFPQVRLVLAGADKDVSPDGNGTYLDYLSRLARALNIEKQVRFAGHLPRIEMPQLYAAADVVAHPAIGEPFGLAVVEGMLSARPVVAAGAGGVPEIIRDGVDGLLVRPRQPAALAAALRRVLSDPALAAKLAAAGRERVLARFTPPVQAARLLEIYRSLAGPQPRRSGFSFQ